MREVFFDDSGPPYIRNSLLGLVKDLGIGMALLSPQNTLAPYGFVVLISAIFALFQEPGRLPGAYWFAEYLLMAFSIMIFGARQLQIETKNPSTQSLLPATDPHALQRFIVMCMIAVLILSIGAALRWPIGIIAR